VSRDPTSKRALTPAEAVQAAELFQQAQALHQQGRLAEARDCYGAVLTRDPGHAEALHLAGVIGFQTGQLEQGVELVRRAIALNPNAPAPYANLGQALIGLGRYAEAAQALGRAVTLQPGAARAQASLGVALMELGDIQAALARFEAALALQPGFAEAHNSRGLALHRLSRMDEAVASFDQAIRLQPSQPGAYVNAANALGDAGRADEALGRLDAALKLRPDLVEALTSRAIVLRQLGRPKQALDDLALVARLRPDIAAARYNLGAQLKDLRRLDEALVELDAAIALQPQHLGALYSRGVALAELRRSAEAVAAFSQAIALKPDYAEAIYARALSRLQLGDFDEGLRDYEQRKALSPPLGRRPYAEPEWLGEQDMKGKTLLLHHEQGFGDTLLFSRYAKLAEARGAEVVLSVQAPLTRLMQTLGPTIRVIGEGERPDRFDLHAPLMSLPLAFGTRLNAIPAEPRYLASDDALRARWAQRLPATKRRRIGLVWASNRENLQLTQRSLGLEAMRPLLEADADWISLQKDPAPGEAEAFEALGGLHLGDDLQDFADTAALIDLMDLVITVDTGVAHLAGALGRPVCILLAFNPDWRWLFDRSDSPWYPNARLFRQPAPGDWTSVISDVKAALDP
jgi:tetratricopeptide (TPR) repeat protein